MRTSLLLILAAFGLSTAATAQTTMLAAAQTTTLTPPDPGARPEARDLINQTMEAELQKPALVKNHAKLVYVDIKGEAATARVDYDGAQPAKTFYYHLRQKDGQWVILNRDGYAQVKM